MNAPRPRSESSQSELSNASSLARVDEWLRTLDDGPVPNLGVRVMTALAGRERRAPAFRLRWQVVLAGAVLLATGGFLAGRATAGRGGQGGAASATAPVAARYVHFALSAPGAQSVVLVGDFNGWRTDAATPMHSRGDGTFTAGLELQPGRYAYAFVVDGRRVLPDPGASAYEDDGFGGRNSVLEL